jgi:N-acetylglucosamine-6-sulfatase
MSLAVTAFALVACEPPASDEAPPPTRVDGEVPPNVILVVTDDQTAGSMEGEPVAMPWLDDRLGEPGWTTFTNAIVTTPLCCPSRASILTGRVASHTGVLTNEDGDALDDADTLAVWLHDAGYHTALIGKYLNGYPWDDPPPIPPGWDRWFAKLNASRATVYSGYDVVDDGERRTVGSAPEDYATDRLAREAVAFVASAAADRPFFVYFAPSAPHEPAEPAPRHASLLEQPAPVPDASALSAMNDVSGAPGWIRERPPIDAEAGAALAEAQLRERVALRAVDDALRALWEAVDGRGELDRTIWIFLSDNGYSFGDRRWVGKTCPWETCIHVPFVVHAPGTPGGISPELVANIDVAPTISDLAGVDAPAVDGVSLVDVIEHGTSPARRAVPIEWSGDGRVPAWSGVRTPNAVLIHHADGTVELYDLPKDPDQRRNLAHDPSAGALRARAERALARALGRSLAGARGDR